MTPVNSPKIRHTPMMTHPWHTAQQQPRLSVPETAQVPNPIVVTLSANLTCLRVCADCRPRALRIIHALVDGAVARGQSIAPADDPAGSFVVVAKGHRYPVSVWEATERVPDGCGSSAGTGWAGKLAIWRDG